MKTSQTAYATRLAHGVWRDCNETVYETKLAHAVWRDYKESAYANGLASPVSLNPAETDQLKTTKPI